MNLIPYAKAKYSQLISIDYVSSFIEESKGTKSSLTKTAILKRPRTRKLLTFMIIVIIRKSATKNAQFICCSQVTDVGTSKILEGRPQLQSLVLTYYDKVSNKDRRMMFTTTVAQFILLLSSE